MFLQQLFHTYIHGIKYELYTLLLVFGEPFFYIAFACCVNVYTVSVHTGST